MARNSGPTPRRKPWMSGLDERGLPDGNLRCGGDGGGGVQASVTRLRRVDGSKAYSRQASPASACEDMHMASRLTGSYRPIDLLRDTRRKSPLLQRDSSGLSRCRPGDWALAKTLPRSPVSSPLLSNENVSNHRSCVQRAKPRHRVSRWSDLLAPLTRVFRDRDRSDDWSRAIAIVSHFWTTFHFLCTAGLTSVYSSQNIPSYDECEPSSVADRYRLWAVSLGGGCYTLRCVGPCCTVSHWTPTKRDWGGAGGGTASSTLL
jgi:hypothetical protein